MVEDRLPEFRFHFFPIYFIPLCLFYEDLCVFEYLKHDSDFLIALRASFKLPCAYLNCAFTHLQGGYCFSGGFVTVLFCGIMRYPI